MLEVLGKGSQLRFHNTLWVHYGGVETHYEADYLVLTGRDPDSYVKVLNHFGRVLKLFTFDQNRWVDGETGGAPGPLDETLVGRIPTPKAPPVGAKPVHKKKAAPSRAKTASPRKKTGAAKAAGGKGGKKSTGKGPS